MHDAARGLDDLAGDLASDLADGIAGEVVDGVLLHLAVLAAYEAGLFAALAAGPRELGALAETIGLGERETASLAAAALAAGLLERGPRLALSAAGRILFRRDSPRYAGSLFELGIGLCRDFYTLPRLTAALRAGGPTGARWLDWLATPATAAAFTAAMDAHSVACAARWPAAAPLAGHRRLLDVAGGSGAHAIGAVAAHPNLAATVLELPEVAAVARAQVAARGLGARIEVAVGDMWHDPWPAADVHLFADVLHDWSPERAAALLARSFAALPSGGRVLIHEMLLDDDRLGPPAVTASDLAMLLVTGGRQYSRPELFAMLAGAGFVRPVSWPVLGDWSMVSGSKP